MLLENLPNTQICPEDLGSTERQLRNSDLTMTYWIMLSGFCTAIVVFFTEVTLAVCHFDQWIATWMSCAIFQIMFKCLNARLHYRDEHAPFQRQFQNKWSKPSSNVTPPPSYATLFHRNQTNVWTSSSMNKSMDSSGGVQQYINGRNYMVFRNDDGEARLVPLRTPSAALFQYAYTK